MSSHHPANKHGPRLWLVSLLLLTACAQAPSPIVTPAAPPTALPTNTIAPAPTDTATPVPTETSTPAPTPIPGIQVFPLSSLGEGVPWLSYDRSQPIMSVYYGFNVERPPFDSVLVRQALAAAIDKEEIALEAREFQFREVTPATTLTPPAILGRDLYGEVGIPFDPEKARSLLEEAGYASVDAFPSTTLIVYMRGAAAPGAHFRLAQTVVGMWKANLGIAVTIDTLESPAALISRMRSDGAAMYLLAWGADYADPDNFLKTLLHSGADLNLGHFNSPTYDSIVDRAAVLSDPAQRQLLYMQAEQILTEQEVALIPLFHSMLYTGGGAPK
jgi:ABC-type transport system substrate-binding protein